MTESVDWHDEVVRKVADETDLIIGSFADAEPPCRRTIKIVTVNGAPIDLTGLSDGTYILQAIVDPQRARRSWSWATRRSMSRSPEPAARGRWQWPPAPTM